MTVVTPERNLRTVLVWESRQALLERIGDDSRATGIVAAFVGPGTSAPVELDRDHVPVLFGLLNEWADEVEFAKLPLGIEALRDDLDEELRAPAYQ